RPASTHKAIALLALEHNAPLLVVGAPKVAEPMGYHVVAEDLILPEEYATDPDAVRSITRRFTAALERLIRRHPEQYFWLHRPWAGCRDEREKPPDPFRLLKPSDLVPLSPVSMTRVGRYAYKITWSDGHDTGIFTLEHLRALCQCPDCAKPV